MARADAKEAGIPYRELGRTGERVSAIGLGGWHLALPGVSEQLALRIVRRAIDEGINFLDNSWDYNGGASERRMGKALRGGYREKVFLMTKIDGRSGREATRQLDESLRRLKTDRIDLVQHHEVLRFDDPHRVFEERGANAALVAARKAGKLRYIGFTGHKDPRVHLHMLEVAAEHGFRFDTVQMPLNSLANGLILKSGKVTAIECLHYALNLPTSVVITGCDSMKILEQALEAARTFRPLSRAAVKELLGRTRQEARSGERELFKTTSIFDATAEHPEWMGEEPRRYQQMMPG